MPFRARVNKNIKNISKKENKQKSTCGQAALHLKQNTGASWKGNLEATHWAISGASPLSHVSRIRRECNYVLLLTDAHPWSAKAPSLSSFMLPGAATVAAAP